MRPVRAVAVVGLLAVELLAVPRAVAQSVEKELVATISGPAIDRAVVSEILWAGGTLVIQTVAAQKDGTLAARYFAAPGAGMTLKALAAPPAGSERYWTRKASRTSPTGLGTITLGSDAKMPMYGIGSLQTRINDAVNMGGTIRTHTMRLGGVTLHTRRDVEPYDGEIWSWSPPEINRIAWVDDQKQLWIARADGGAAERIARGDYTLPAWSDDGRLLAVAERKDGGRRWDIVVLHLPEKYRRP